MRRFTKMGSWLAEVKASKDKPAKASAKAKKGKK